jgi:hypothetical protein
MVQMGRAFRVDENARLPVLHHTVPRSPGTESHRILKAGAPPFFHRQTQALQSAFFTDKVQERGNGTIGHLDHFLFL